MWSCAQRKAESEKGPPAVACRGTGGTRRMTVGESSLPKSQVPVGGRSYQAGFTRGCLCDWVRVTSVG